MKTCVLIPAYNEAKTIAELVAAVKAKIPDVVVIDDGSADDTADLARQAGAVVLGSRGNAGKGRALKYGFDYAVKNGYDAVVAMDADGQHSPDDLANIINAAVSSGAGIVVGNRMGNPEKMPASRFATNLLMSLIISLICRQNIPDTQCGYRFIKTDALKKINLISSNYEIESELLMRAARQGCKIASVPIKSVYEGQLSLIHPMVDTWRFFVLLGRVLLT
jgi:glycosyltransferase involved in cell wall biosynthesis